MGDAVCSSADAELFSYWGLNPGLRRLRTLLPGATHQERRKCGFGRYARSQSLETLLWAFGRRGEDLG